MPVSQPLHTPQNVCGRTHRDNAAVSGLDQELQVAICSEWAAGVPAPGAAQWRADVAGPAADQAGQAGQAGLTPPPTGWAWSAAGAGSLDGLALRLRATRPVTCHWQAVRPSRLDRRTEDETWAGRIPPVTVLGEPATELLRFGRSLLDHPGEHAGTVAARLRAVAACLEVSPWRPGTPLVIDDACEGGWVLVHGGTATAACTVVEIAGVPGEVAVSMATWPADSPAPLRPGGGTGQAAPAANGSPP
jgi:hypothetical protein